MSRRILAISLLGKAIVLLYDISTYNQLEIHKDVLGDVVYYLLRTLEEA
jgi:lipid-A-disaccharide synthase-like uncharacterized protein